MLNFNFDAYQTKTITIAGRDFEVNFNDHFQSELLKLEAKIFAVQKTMEALDNGTIDDATDEIIKVGTDALAEMKAAEVAFFDEFLGDGAGEWLYKKANHSTQALAKLVGVLRQEADKQGKNRKARRGK